MNIAKLALVAAAPIAMMAATPALAQSQVAVGATVTGPQGNPVGTITAVENGQAILDTGKHKIPLALDMYGEGETGPTITVTKEQINTMADQQLAEGAAKRDAALVVGASVMDADHQPLGNIVEIAGDQIVIARGGDETDKVTLMRNHFDAMGTGVMARLTNAQIDQAMAQMDGQASPAETAAETTTEVEAETGGQ